MLFFFVKCHFVFPPNMNYCKSGDTLGLVCEALNVTIAANVERSTYIKGGI